MLPIAGQTAGPNGLNFFEGTHKYPVTKFNLIFFVIDFFQNSFF